MVDKNKNWGTFKGYTKDEEVIVNPEALNNYIRKHGVNRGNIVAFNFKKELVLVEFREISYIEKHDMTRTPKHPFKWVNLIDIMKK